MQIWPKLAEMHEGRGRICRGALAAKMSVCSESDRLSTGYTPGLACLEKAFKAEEGQTRHLVFLGWTRQSVMANYEGHEAVGWAMTSE